MCHEKANSDANGGMYYTRAVYLDAEDPGAAE